LKSTGPPVLSTPAAKRKRKKQSQPKQVAASSLSQAPKRAAYTNTNDPDEIQVFEFPLQSHAGTIETTDVSSFFIKEV
jgi:hypothetical protein